MSTSKQDREKRIKDIEDSVKTERANQLKIQETTKKKSDKLYTVIIEVNDQIKKLNDLVMETNSQKTILDKAISEVDKNKKLASSLQASNTNKRIELQELKKSNDKDLELVTANINKLRKDLKEKSDIIDNRLKSMETKNTELDKKETDIKRQRKDLDDQIKHHKDNLSKSKTDELLIKNKQIELDNKIKESEKVISKYNALEELMKVRERKTETANTNNNDIKEALKDRTLELDLREGMLNKREKRVEALIETNNLKKDM